ncbi:MAG TPA: NACHT domain-containing protein [Rhizomicrobium sp.]|jgi:hypothetical protein
MASMVQSQKTAVGGSAALGGFRYQARVTAIAAIHLARGIPLRWLDGLTTDIPVVIAAETGGPGDDIRVQLHNGKLLEAQVKRGLRADARLWDALLALAQGVHAGTIDYGVLVLSPDSSGTIQNELATDLMRIGDGRTDGLRSLGRSLLAQLTGAGLSPAGICSRLRIVTIHALDLDSASVAAAQAELAHLCRDQVQVSKAWEALCEDALSLIERRGQRDVSTILRALEFSQVALRADSPDPVSFVSQLCQWVLKTSKEFSVFGIDTPLLLDTAWLPLSLVIQNPEQKQPSGLQDALLQYHDWHKRDFGPNTTHIAPDSLTRFYRHCVVVAGPGMGKSTFIKKLARLFAGEQLPVLKVSLPLVASRMQQGASFEEALFMHALDSSGLTREAAAESKVHHWVLLGDGLDECGPYQEMIAQGLLAFVASQPLCRTLITTRPVGYTTALLKSWRHYEVLPLDANKHADHMEQLLTGILPNDSVGIADILSFASVEIKKSKTKDLVTRSPLLLGLSLSLAIRHIAFGQSKSQLYEKLFGIIDSIPSTRKPPNGPSHAVLMRFLDVLGWDMVFHPVSAIADIMRRCAAVLQADLKLAPLQALDRCERCSEYWQSVGMLERVQHAGDETLAFVHKTFGEFAAARFLASMPAARLAAEVAAILHNESASEVIGFSGSLGAAEIICAELMKHCGSPPEAMRNLPRALALLVEDNKPPSAELRRQVLALATKLLASPDLETSDATGIALLPVAEKFPGDVAAAVLSLTNHERVWTRLAAWAALVTCGEKYYDLAQMLDAFQTIPRDSRRGLSSSLGGYSVLNRTGYELMQAFALTAMKVVLKRLVPGEAEAFLKEAFHNNRLQSIGTIQSAHAILKAFNRSYSLIAVPTDFGKEWANLEFDHKTYFEMNNTAFTRMFQPLYRGSNKNIPVAGPLYQLSALMDMTGVWEMAGSDIWEWRDASLLAEEAVVMRATAAVSGLDQEALSNDVDTFLSVIAERTDDKISSIFDRTVHVDAPPLDWAKAASLDIDLGSVERALHHGSDWLIQLAANVLDAAVPKNELPIIVQRLLSSGSGTTLWAACNLARTLGEADCLRLLYECVGPPITYGCEYIFNVLKDCNAPLDGDLLRALEWGLLGPTAKAAVAAAKLALSLADPSTAQLLPVLKSAYAHWQTHEEPYPEKGGVVPGSPRSEIVQALQKIEPLSDEQLFQMSSDPRSDVRGVVTAIVQERLSSDHRFAMELIRKIACSEFQTRPLIDALRQRKPLGKEQIDAIQALLTHDNPTVRFSALGVLDTAYLDNAQMRTWISALERDPEAEIRERAAQISHRLYPPAM